MGLNILIIDDDEDFGEALTIFLEKKDHYPQLATTALAGLKKAKEEPTDVILLDLLLPGMEGVIALDLIQKDLPEIAVLIISGLPLHDKRVQLALKAGPKGYLQKPFRMQHLLAKLDEIDKARTIQKPRTRNVAIIGLTGAGKTSLMNRFLHNSFSETAITLGIDLEFHYHKNNAFKLMDLAGQQTFKDLLWEQSLRIADGIIFVFDSSSEKDSHEVAKEWFWDAVNDWGVADAPVLFLCNKTDLEGTRIYDIFNYFELQKFSDSKHSFHFLTTSAKTGSGVKNAFEWMFDRIIPQEITTASFSKLWLLKSDDTLLAGYNFDNGETNSVKVEQIKQLINDKFPNEKPATFEGVFAFQNSMSLIVMFKEGISMAVLGHCTDCNVYSSKLDKLLDFAINILALVPDAKLRKSQLEWLIKNEFDDFIPKKDVVSKEDMELIILAAIWNQATGPKLLTWYPRETDLDLHQIASTCFMASISIFGHSKTQVEPVSVSLPIKYANKEARILFDLLSSENNKNKDTFAVITLVPSLDHLDLFNHDSMILNERAKTTLKSEWNDELMKNLHTSLRQKAIK
ncbi:MAG: ADP-ribosylation factor-like protein [Candidatus Hodarchaeales archaeon]|jgi:small GTP-binding protein